MKPSDVKNAVPSIQAIGVDDSIQKDGSYKDYDVTVSVSFSPKAGQNQLVASKTERMSATKFAAFREDTNEWTGQDFLKEHFSDVWDKVQKQAEDAATFQSKPLIYVVNQQGQPSDGQPVPTTQSDTPSSVAIALQGSLKQAQVKKAPAAPAEDAYVAPATGPATPEGEGNVPNYPYEANETNDYKADDAVVKAVEGGAEPQLPEQTASNQPEQAGTNTAEQPQAAQVVEAAQGGATPATTASDTGKDQAPNQDPTPKAPEAPQESK